MADEPRVRIVVIDDHPVIGPGLAAVAPALELVASFLTVEDFLASPAVEMDVVLLDLQLGAAAPADDDGAPLMGTAAIRRILEAGRGPVVVYTSIAENMLLAACLAAGALGAATKN